MTSEKMFEASKEKKKLKAIIKNIPKDKIKLVDGLIHDAAFMAEQLESLRAYIEENGWSEEYQNGANQSGKKISVEADCYIKVQKSYAAVIRQLTDFLPDSSSDVTTKAGESLAAFVMKGKVAEYR